MSESIFKSGRSTRIFNIILTLLYVPLSYIGIFTVFFADGIKLYGLSTQIIMIGTIALGLSMPIVSVIGILLSVYYRRKDKTTAAFFVQFIPLAVFVLMLVLLLIIIP